MDYCAPGYRQEAGTRVEAGLDNLQEPASVSAALRSHVAKMSQSVHSRSVLTGASGHFSIIRCVPAIGNLSPCYNEFKRNITLLIVINKILRDCKHFLRIPCIVPDQSWAVDTYFIRDFIFRYLPFVDLDISKEILRTSQLVCR